MKISDRPTLARIVDAIAQLCPYKLPLYLAAANGAIAVLEVPRDATPTASTLRKTIKKPVVAILGDDDYQSTGPTGFRSASTFRKWAKAAIIHAAGGEPQHYENAAAGALLPPSRASR